MRKATGRRRRERGYEPALGQATDPVPEDAAREAAPRDHDARALRRMVERRTHDLLEHEVAERPVAVPALEALLGLDEHGTGGRIDVDGREPLDPREAVPSLATPLRVCEVSDESVRVRRFQAERDQTPPRLGLGHRPGTPCR